MTRYHDKEKKAARVSEAIPLQVYLGAHDQDLLGRLAGQLSLTKSDVIRRALSALEGIVFDSTKHPALAVVGMVVGDDGMSGPVDTALEHDRILADSHEVAPPPTRRQVRGGR